MVYLERKNQDREELKKELKIKSNLNDTSTFLLPAFGVRIQNWFKFGFVNAYLSDINREKTNDKDIHLYLLFKPNDKQKAELNKKISDLSESDINKTDYIEDYDYEEGYIVLVLKFPEKYRKDYNRFLKGKYSYFSEEYRNLFTEDQMVEFINENDKVEKLASKSFQWLVINRDPRMKKFTEKKYDIQLSPEDEVYHLYVEEKETLDVDKLK